MTDNEIIKALEDCSTYAYHYCGECGFKDGDLLKAALDLINRRKAEIERLKNNQVIHIDINEQFKKECEHEIKTAKAEAVKEFANEVTSVCYQEFGSELEIAHTFAEIVTETLKHWGEK